MKSLQKFFSFASCLFMQLPFFFEPILFLWHPSKGIHLSTISLSKRETSVNHLPFFLCACFPPVRPLHKYKRGEPFWNSPLKTDHIEFLFPTGNPCCQFLFRYLSICLFTHKVETDDMDRGGENPGNGVGDVEHLWAG